jgi:hypothetical protein
MKANPSNDSYKPSSTPDTPTINALEYFAPL